QFGGDCHEGRVGDTRQLDGLVGEGERGALHLVEAGRRLPILQGFILLVGDADILADALVGDDFVRRLAQNAGARDRKLPNDRIKLALVADGATEPAILLEVAGRMRHHTKDVGVTVFAEQFARTIVVLCGIAVIDAGHISPLFTDPPRGFQSLDSPNEYRPSDATAPCWSQIAAVLLFELGTVDIRL